MIDLLAALSSNQSIFNRNGAKIILSLISQREGILIHELQHYRDDQSEDGHLVEGHSDGPDRNGNHVSFCQRACSWYEETIFKGVIYSSRERCRESLDTLELKPYFEEGTPESLVFKNFLDLMTKLENCERGVRKISQLLL